MAFYNVLKSVAGPSLRGFYKPWIRGAENIPAEGPGILASNHNAVWDSIFLPALIDREVVFMGKADYFSGTGFKGWATKNFMKAVGTIPVDRSGGKGAQAALQAGLDRLAEGELFGIYPEGTRSPDGRLYRGRTGVARLALESGAPVIPVAMIGMHEAQPVGKRVPLRTDIGILIGEPLDFSRYRGLHRDRYTLRAVTDEIMYAIMVLSEQEYVDLYAADVKAQLAAEGQFDGPVPTGAAVEVEEGREPDEATGAPSEVEPAEETINVEIDVEVEEETPQEREQFIVRLTDKMYREDLAKERRRFSLRRRPKENADGDASEEAGEVSEDAQAESTDTPPSDETSET